jgi:predicted DNA-binding transcriptional regulator AlpA
MNKQMTTATVETAAPELMTKAQVAEFFQCSVRQVELMVKAGRIPAPTYFGKQMPRWKRSELMASL